MKHFISLGAGVQSSTMALMAAHGEITPMPDGAIFADTQAEPKSVYEWLDWLEERLPFPVHRVTKGSLTESALTPHVNKKGVTYYKTAIPFHTKSVEKQQIKVGVGMVNGVAELVSQQEGEETFSVVKAGRITHRTCTRDFKIVPLIKYARDQVGVSAMKAWRKNYAEELREWRVYQAYLKAARKAKKLKQDPPPSVEFPRQSWERMQANALACQWIGISLDELNRMKPSRDPWILCRWPLIEQRMSRLSCLDWMRSKGYPEPPRSACVYCPFRSNREWRHLKTTDPDGFAEAVAFDAEARRIRQGTNLTSIPYIHPSLKPLDQVDLRNDTDRGQLTLWDDECTGMCNT